MGRGSQGWVPREVIVGQRPVGITTPLSGQEIATSQSLRLLVCKVEKRHHPHRIPGGGTHLGTHSGGRVCSSVYVALSTASPKPREADC